MKIIKTTSEMKRISKLEHLKQHTIGFVPTMGALHKGHLSLIEKARKDNDIVIVSIFVNPTQFAPNEDLDSYPRTFEHDKELCEEFSDYIFYPETSEIYFNNEYTTVNLSKITEKLCGIKRKGHFQGVATVVNKLFNIVDPDNAYFGLKDYQQYLVIKNMVKDLFLDINIIGCEIIREENGLAMSSRNKYLSNEEKNKASIIYKILKKTKENIIKKNNNIKDLKKEAIKVIKEAGGIIDYFEILNADDLSDNIENNIVIAIAVYFGKARLIDNILLT